ncbi:C-type lectin domain family 5 member A isoform X1 [Myotis daubentonii]|uniref:C-type lectin domain family 5 member A isoform X1 n=1 Tax=Myotis daubentonii TaxID=98922 RepID=UPI0028732164|nr:C-type lectin domain family 5 member A isoform X1 [Myotis daubentonii]
MNWWCMIISGLIVVVLKVAGVTLFLLYFPQIFGQCNDSCSPTGSYGTVPQIFGNGSDSFSPTESYGTVCPSRWDFHQGRCFFFSTSELSWNKSKDLCEAQGSNLAIVNTPEKLKFLQVIAGAEQYFIGLLYQQATKRWHWINNSIFNGNISNQIQNFNCVTIGLTNTFDAASCDVSYRYICEKRAEEPIYS